MFEYENTKRIVYGNAHFIPICERCHRYVKADDKILLNGLGELVDRPNATYSKCGKTKMLFEGFF